MFVIVKINTEAGIIENAEWCDSADVFIATSIAHEMINEEYADRSIHPFNEAKHEWEIKDSLETLGYYQLVGNHRKKLNITVQIVELA